MPSEEFYTLTALVEMTDLPERTIRSWVKAGLLPSLDKRGPGSHWGDQHLDRLLFLKRLRDQSPKRLPLETMRQTLEGLTELQIHRVARGEEPLNVVELMGAPDHRGPGPDRPSRHPNKPRARRHSEQRPYWTTIEVEDGLELRMRSDDPERVAWLARMARRLREWSDEAG